LGLAVVRTIADNHGARLTLESEVGVGTAVSVAFVLGVVSKSETEQTIEPGPMGRGEHVLLVEDNAAVRDILAQHLRVGGYVVTPVADGEQALATLLASGHGVELVVSDIDLPGMDGLACMDEARKRGVELPFVLMSGRSADFAPRLDSRVRLLGKPFRGEELARVVGEALADQPSFD
jgi:CheY-like chemotaxis protein